MAGCVNYAGMTNTLAWQRVKASAEWSKCPSGLVTADQGAGIGGDWAVGLASTRVAIALRVICKLTMSQMVVTSETSNQK